MGDRLIGDRELLRVVRNRLAEFSAFTRRGAADHLGRDPDCGSGCAYCCRAKIVMDAGQGAMIALYLMREGRWTPSLRARLAAADAQMAPVTHAEWFSRAVPCPLLKVEGPGRGRCSVYPVRPVGCAGAWGSRTGDPVDCGETHGTAQVFVSAGPDAMGWLVEYHEAFLRGAGETRHWLYTLPGAVLAGAALLEGRLPPADVFRLPKDGVPPDTDVQTWFDTRAARHVRTPAAP